MKAAYLSPPYQGGIYTIFRSLRAGLAEQGIDVRWVAVGEGANWAKSSGRWSNELAYGEAVECRENNDIEQAAALMQHLKNAGYQIIFINVILTRLFTNIARYLSNDFIKVMIVHNADVRHYKAAAAIRDYVHATVAVSPLVKNELVKNYGFDEHGVQFIPNAIDLKPYQKEFKRKVDSTTFKIISLGRIQDLQKGVFWLPEIMKKLKYPDWQLNIVGSGPDTANLQRRCESLGNKINFLGQMHPDQVPELFAAHDAFIMPSRYEGFGCTLLEAMAAGCIPVVSLIPGVTDQIVDHGKTGAHFPIGDLDAAATQLDELAFNVYARIAISRAARQWVLTKFSTEVMAHSYARLIDELKKKRTPVNVPLHLNNWNYPYGLKAGMRQRVVEIPGKLIRYIFKPPSLKRRAM